MASRAARSSLYPRLSFSLLPLIFGEMRLLRCGQIAVKGDKLINALNRLRPFDKQLFIRLHNAPTAKSDALAVMPFVIAHVAFAADTVVLFQKRLFYKVFTINRYVNNTVNR